MDPIITAAIISAVVNAGASYFAPQPPEAAPRGEYAGPPPEALDLLRIIQQYMTGGGLGGLDGGAGAGMGGLAGGGIESLIAQMFGGQGRTGASGRGRGAGSPGAGSLIDRMFNV